MKKAALWLSRHKMSGIKRRWIVNNMSIVVLLLAIMFIAVGAATTLPMAALYSETAMARAIARLRNAPVIPPCSA